MWVQQQAIKAQEELDVDKAIVFFCMIMQMLLREPFNGLVGSLEAKSTKCRASPVSWEKQTEESGKTDPEQVIEAWRKVIY